MVPSTTRSPFTSTAGAFFTLSLLAWIGVAGCRSNRSDSSSTSGSPSSVPQDLRQVCEARAAKWTRRIHRDCTKCLAVATVPRCEECPTHERAGTCVKEQRARNAEPTCEDVNKCTFRCAWNDCACIEACYQGKDACKKVDAALEACTMQACDADCR